MMDKWENRQVDDDYAFSQTEKLKNTRKTKKLVVITGSYLLQYVDYRKYLRDPNYDVMIMNFGYLIPEAEKADIMFHGSMGYISTFNNCSTFKYFCEDFKGFHIFMMQSKYCAGGAYPIASKDSIITTLKNNKINRYFIATHAYGDRFKKHGFEYVPTTLTEYSVSKIPWGCGGTFNAMALPMILQMGYDQIYVLGIGDVHRAHFYDPEYVQKRFTPVNLPYRKSILNRYSKWMKLCNSLGVKFRVFPSSQLEQSIKNVIPHVEIA